MPQKTADFVEALRKLISSSPLFRASKVEKAFWVFLHQQLSAPINTLEVKFHSAFAQVQVYSFLLLIC